MPISKKAWAKEKASHMKKFHSWLAKGDRREYYPRDVTEAMMWFESEEFVKIPATHHVMLFGESYWLVNNHLYREDCGVFTKLEASEQEKALILALLNKEVSHDSQN